MSECWLSHWLQSSVAPALAAPHGTLSFLALALWSLFPHPHPLFVSSPPIFTFLLCSLPPRFLSLSPSIPLDCPRASSVPRAACIQFTSCLEPFFDPASRPLLFFPLSRFRRAAHHARRRRIPRHDEFCEDIVHHSTLRPQQHPLGASEYLIPLPDAAGDSTLVLFSASAPSLAFHPLRPSTRPRLVPTLPSLVHRTVVSPVDRGSGEKASYLITISSTHAAPGGSLPVDDDPLPLPPGALCLNSPRRRHALDTATINTCHHPSCRLPSWRRTIRL